MGCISPRSLSNLLTGPTSQQHALGSAVCERDLLCLEPSKPFLELIPSSAFIGTEGREDSASPSLPQPAGDLHRALEAR